MISQDLLNGQKSRLASIIKGCFGRNRQSDGFALRVLGTTLSSDVLGVTQFDFASATEEIKYGGFPSVAYVGFGLGSQDVIVSPAADIFVEGLNRLQERPDSALTTMQSDDVSLLGIAEGLANLKHHGSDPRDSTSWLLRLIDRLSSEKQWSTRMRLLSSDLLDGRGRLRTLPDTNNVDETALEAVMRVVWPQRFIGIGALPEDVQNDLLKTMLLSEPPIGDLERAAIWLKALDILVDYACRSLFPSISDTSRLLQHVQHALKRWVWKDKSRRASTAAPSRWLIDEESDVQSLLWAILYPIYGSELVDEQYLPYWGNVQPRADLGIVKLKLIIEVKMARKPADFVDFEGQIGNDLGLYFRDTTQFDRMIVFVYDDCDEHHPEKYDSLRNALMKRERLEDVVIIQRPGMIPDRGQRK